MKVEEIKRAGVTFVALLVLAGTLGCTEKYGRLKRSFEANQIFEAYQVLPHHNYYFSGPEGRPDAILGLHQNRHLKSSQWTPVELTPQQLKKMVDWLNFHYPNRTRYYPYGAEIFDDAGNRVGLWYSIWDWTPVIIGPEDTIEVFAPPLSSPFESPPGNPHDANW